MGEKGRAEGNQKETTTARISQGAGDKHRHTRDFFLKMKWTEAGVVVQIKLLRGMPISHTGAKVQVPATPLCIHLPANTPGKQ